MQFVVDADAADVELFGDKLGRLKELNLAMAKSLSVILDATANASKTIKPVLADVNKLNASDRHIDKAISMLEEVRETAAELHRHEQVLSSDIDSVSLRTFLSSLTEGKRVRRMSRGSITRFRGMLLHFDLLLDSGDRKAQAYLRTLVRLPASRLLHEWDNNMPPEEQLASQKTSVRRDLEKIALLVDYFSSDSEYVAKAYTQARTDIVLTRIQPLIAATAPVERGPRIPYERGSNGIMRFNAEVMKCIGDELALAQKLGFSVADIANQLGSRVVTDLYVGQVITPFLKFFESPAKVLESDALAFEAVDAIALFELFLQDQNMTVAVYSQCASKFMALAATVFQEYIRDIEYKISSNRSALTESAINDIMVKCTLSLRKAADHRHALLTIMSTCEAGDWLMFDPPPRFWDVLKPPPPPSGTDESSAEYKLAAFYADAIDAVAINVETSLRVNSGEVSLKKSTQGLFLLKGLIFLENIITRTSSTYNIMGALGMDRLSRLKSRFVGVFLDDWKAVLWTIMKLMTEAMAAASSGGGAISTLGSRAPAPILANEKAKVKHLFESFNALFEEALRNYERYNIADEALRTLLRTEIKRLVTSVYFKLYDRYGTSGFAKNMDKYVKYDKKLFERLLNERL